MSMFPDQAITTPEALVSTVKTDYISYGWFAVLVQLPSVRADLSGADTAKLTYLALTGARLAQRLCTVVLLFGLAAAVWRGAGMGLSIILTMVSAALIVLHTAKRRRVARLCALLFARDFQQEQFARKTLYQIGEHYAARHGMLPLVDAVALTDRAVWAAFLLAVFATYFVYPLGIGAILFCVIAAVYGTRAAVNTSLIYKFLRS